MHSDSITNVGPPYVAGLLAGPSTNSLSLLATASTSINGGCFGGWDTDHPRCCSLGAQYRIGLVAGPNANELAIVATTSIISSAPGYFIGGPVTIPGVQAGNTATVQVVAWDASNGPTLFDALATGGFYGASPTFAVVTGGAGVPPSVPAPLLGLTSFGFPLGGPRPPVPPFYMTRTGNTLIFSWPFSVSQFSIQQSPDLNGNQWTTLTNLPTFTGTKNRIILPAPTQRMFYRLQSLASWPF
jgi:hypothetical protein